MLEDDMMGWLDGKEATVAWSEMTGFQIATAPEVSKLYQGNVVAGDAKFNGKPVVLKGTVLSVKKRPFNKTIYYNLKGHRSFSYVEVSPTQKLLEGASSINPGDQITMGCIGKGSTELSTPVFHCDVVSVFADMIRTKIISRLDAWLNGETVIGWKLTKGKTERLLASFYLAKWFSPDSPCLSKMDDKCLTDIQKLMGSLDKRIPMNERRQQFDTFMAGVKFIPTADATSTK
jgi:hypothetical protein